LSLELEEVDAVQPRPCSAEASRPRRPAFAPDRSPERAFEPLDLALELLLEVVMVRFIGLDVHKRVVEVCVVDAEGRILWRHRFDLTRESLERFARERLTREDRVALEATSNTWAVVRILKPFVDQVVVSNPLKTKAIAEANVKTDKVDALVLAQLLRCDFLPRVWEPDEKTQELRRLTGRRSGLVCDLTGVKNRIHSVLAQRLLVPAVGDLFGSKGMSWLREVALDPEGRLMIDSDLRVIEILQKEIASFDAILAKEGYQDPRVKLLMTQPGVDVAVAQAVLAALGDINRFTDGDHAASYLGLVPSTKQSADHCYHGPITKAGNGHARWMLIQAAQHLRTNPGPLGVFFRKLSKKKNHNVAVVAAARKLVVVSWHMLTKNEPYRYAQPRVTEHKLRRLRVKVTGQRRKTGMKLGEKAVSKLGPGVKSYTIKSLAQVYLEEGLPTLAATPAGETETIRKAGVSKYVQSLSQSQVVASKERAPA
jgi:transposase